MPRAGRRSERIAGAMITPAAVLAELWNKDKKLALPLLAGLSVFAAAAIVSAWRVDVIAAASMGVYILAFALLLYAVRLIVNDRTLRKVLSWFVTLFLLLVTLTFFISAVFINQSIIAPTYCLVRLWQRCETVTRSVANRVAPGFNDPATAPVTEATRVNAFTFQTSPHEVEPGARFWTRSGEYWIERYPSGYSERFIELGRIAVDGCPGTTAAREGEPGFQVFLPDKGCPAMVARWRRAEEAWKYLGQMQDVS